MGGYGRCATVPAGDIHFDGPLSTKTSEPEQDTFSLKILVWKKTILSKSKNSSEPRFVRYS